ncbi:MAG: hypothetical protein RLZ47_319 [Bacteroidota bacterium]|jgi:thiopeptide-type bacteriocin biosynthesis protein
MNIQALPTAVCRTPAFAMNTDLFTVWEELKAHIGRASPDFYKLIADKRPEDWSTLNEKVRFTIWKYFNRSCFRATPFGSFAAFTTVPLNDSPASPIHLKASMQLHHFIDWDKKSEVDKSQLYPELKLFCNSSLYIIAKDLRYISYDGEQFQLSSIELFPELEAITSACKSPLSIKNVLGLLQSNFNLASESGQELILQLLEAQVLFSELEANITGQDYFDRLGMKTQNETPTYLLAERTLIKGNLCTNQLHQLPSFFEFAARVMGKVEQRSLEEFRTAFLRKFEHNEVPLMQALDPELGIGYQGLEQVNSEVLVELSDIETTASQQTLNYGDFEKFLLRGILSGSTIPLHEFKPKDEQAKLRLPNSFNVLVQFYEGRPVLISGGGCTANSLNGRFSLASQKIEDLNRENAIHESKANPEVIFAELAYQAEKHIDNVNRRKHSYAHEIPILCWSEGTDIIQPNDLYVSVQNEEIVLRSGRLNQRVVPRLSSAYNYGRSDLSLYRFLCDLQAQGLHSQLSFKPWDFFPGLDYYPRTEYKEIIISPARWCLPENLVKNPEEAGLINWLSEKQIHSPFKCGHADHILCFDPSSSLDRWAFLQYLQQQCNHEVYVWEALLDDHDSPSDESGGRYAAEWVINYGHHNQIYAPINRDERPNYFPIPEHEISLLTDEWIYVEIYGNESRANGLLLGPLQELIQEHHTAIKQWFFIRYNDPTPHIRFRFKAIDINMGIDLLKQLNQILKPEIQKGFIRDLQVKTYYREFRRYGSNRMDLVEAFFHRDSLFVLEQLNSRSNLEQFYADTLWYIDKLSATALPCLDEQLSFVQQTAQSFADEFGWAAPQFKQLNQQYRSLKQLETTEIVIDLTQLGLLEQLMGLCENEKVKWNLLADLIHMHVNRSFSESQRKQEAMIYQFLLIRLKSKKASTYASQQFSA